jgi:hypothetical protein
MPNKIDLLRQFDALNKIPDKKLQPIDDYAVSLYKRVEVSLKKACGENGIYDFSISLVSAIKGENISEVFGDIFEKYNQMGEKNR